jgi:hypothetical protein
VRGEPVILSYGMGVDSSAILARWLLEPSSRDFDLDDLVVLTAQTGDEFQETARQVEQYMLPLLRANGVRFVQVARAGLLQTQGTRVLSDTTSPRRIHLKGDYSLSDEQLTQGSVPQYAKGKRQCSIKSKGWPLDATIKAVLEGAHFSQGDFIEHTTDLSTPPFRHVIGFNADEQSRADRNSSYSTVERHSEYPLIDDWHWTRADVEAYLAETFGEVWLKSCCVFCPFTGARAAHIERLLEHPEAARFSLLIEHGSLALNPNQAFYSEKPLTRTHLDKLLAKPPEALTPRELTRIGNVPWGSRSLWDTLREAGEDGLLTAFDSDLDDVYWAVVHIRRVVGGGPSARSLVRLVDELDRDEALEMIQALSDHEGVEVRLDRRQGRVWFRARVGDVAFMTGLHDHRVKELRRLRTGEDFIVATPAFAVDKTRKGFETRWENMLVDDVLNRRRAGLGRVLP